MYEDHLKACEYCQKGKGSSKPTISIKSASYRKQKKLTELAAIIKGTSYPSLEPIPIFRTKAASVVGNNIPRTRKSGPIEREVKLKELGKMIKGFVG
jgi:hypothetical protein